MFTKAFCIGGFPSTTKIARRMSCGLYFCGASTSYPAASRLPPGAGGKDSPTRLRRSPFGRPLASENAPIMSYINCRVDRKSASGGTSTVKAATTSRKMGRRCGILFD